MAAEGTRADPRYIACPLRDGAPVLCYRATSTIATRELLPGALFTLLGPRCIAETPRETAFS